jgi:hypothetical protein
MGQIITWNLLGERFRIAWACLARCCSDEVHLSSRAVVLGRVGKASRAVRAIFSLDLSPFPH